MRREQCRPVLVGGGIAEHGVTAAVERVEARIGVPRFIEVQAIDDVAGDLDHAFDVVDQSIVGRIRDDGMARLEPVRAGGQRIRAGPLPDRFRLQVFRVDRADDAVAIAVRHEKDRDRPGHHQAMLDGFVAVAVAQGDVVLRQARHEYDAVGARRAVGDRV